MTEPFKLKWKMKGFYDLRRSPKVVKDLEKRGKKICDAANATLRENSLGNRVRARRPGKVGYKMSSFQGRKVKQGRWFVQVYTSSNHAKHSDAVHNTLVRVLNETQNPTPAATNLRDEA